MPKTLKKSAKKSAKKTTKKALVRKPKTTTIERDFQPVNVKKERKPKAPKWTTTQISMFIEAGKKIGKNIPYTSVSFAQMFGKFIPSTDEIVQMGTLSAANGLARTIKLRMMSKEQREVYYAAQKGLRHEMIFSVNLESLPSTERIAKIGKDAAAVELMNTSRYWGGIFG